MPTPRAPGRQPPVRDADKVMAALKRALKVVGAVKQQRKAAGLLGAARGAAHAEPASAAALYLDILNQYLYYFSAGAETMTPGVVQQLLELVQSELSAARELPGGLDADAARMWDATRAHIAYQQSGTAGPESQARYAAFSVCST
jgi:hypothetical protein